MVVINELELMKETLVKQGDVFAGRPSMYLINILLKGNYGLLFTRGQMWRENRRFALHVLRDFGLGRNQLYSQIMEQATELVSILHQQNGPVNVRDYLLVSFKRFNMFNFVDFATGFPSIQVNTRYFSNDDPIRILCNKNSTLHEINTIDEYHWNIPKIFCKILNTLLKFVLLDYSKC